MKNNKVKLKDCILYMEDDRVFVSDDHKIAEILICFSTFIKSDFCKDLEISELDLKSIRSSYSDFIKKLDLNTKNYDREEVIYDYKKGPEGKFKFFINMDTFVSTNKDVKINIRGLSLLVYLIAEKSDMDLILLDLVLDIIREYLMKK